MKKDEDSAMRPVTVAVGTIMGAMMTVAATIYYQQFFPMNEKLALWTIIAEIVGLGGLISAEAYVFLWGIRARTFGWMSKLKN